MRSSKILSFIPHNLRLQLRKLKVEDCWSEMRVTTELLKRMSTTKAGINILFEDLFSFLTGILISFLKRGGFHQLLVIDLQNIYPEPRHVWRIQCTGGVQPEPIDAFL